MELVKERVRLRVCNRVDEDLYPLVDATTSRVDEYVGEYVGERLWDRVLERLWAPVR